MPESRVVTCAICVLWEADSPMGWECKRLMGDAIRLPYKDLRHCRWLSRCPKCSPKTPAEAFPMSAELFVYLSPSQGSTRSSRSGAGYLSLFSQNLKYPLTWTPESSFNEGTWVGFWLEWMGWNLKWGWISIIPADGTWGELQPATFPRLLQMRIKSCPRPNLVAPVGKRVVTPCSGERP